MPYSLGPLLGEEYLLAMTVKHGYDDIRLFSKFAEASPSHEAAALPAQHVIFGIHSCTHKDCAAPAFCSIVICLVFSDSGALRCVAAHTSCRGSLFHRPPSSMLMCLIGSAWCPACLSLPGIGSLTESTLLGRFFVHITIFISYSSQIS